MSRPGAAQPARAAGAGLGVRGGRGGRGAPPPRRRAPGGPGGIIDISFIA